MNSRVESLLETNSWGNRIRALKQISEMLMTAEEPSRSWRRVLDITQQSSILPLSEADVLPDVHSVVAQLRAILIEEPPPCNLSFFYFGLVDLWSEQEQREKAGFYVAGGTGQDTWREIASGNISYLPQRRWLSAAILNDIKEAELQIPDHREMLDYAVMFGGAGIIAKFAIKTMGIALPVFVGFDCGDYERVA
jgi:hypothetical protein